MPASPIVPAQTNAEKKYGLQEGKSVSRVLGVIVEESGVHAKLEYEVCESDDLGQNCL